MTQSFNEQVTRLEIYLYHKVNYLIFRLCAMKKRSFYGQEAGLGGDDAYMIAMVL